MPDPATHRRARGRPRSSAPDAGGATVQTLDRAILLLKALSRDGEATLSDLALSVGMPASTAHRLLGALQTHGFVEFAEATQEWMIGVEAFRIGSAFIQRGNLVDAAREVMRGLVDDTGETANLAIADGGEVVFLSQVDTQNPIRAFFRPGMRVHMHSSGIGKALLAEMDRRGVEQILRAKGLPAFTPGTKATPEALFLDLEATRLRGWSLDDEERYSGMRCIAAPIFNAYGEAVAGVSISGPSARLGPDAVGEFGPVVRRAAAKITELIGGARRAEGAPR